jgi:hypothetical protein
MTAVARLIQTQQIHFLRKTVLFSQSGQALTVGCIPAGSVILAPISGALVTTLFNDSGTDLIDIGTDSNDDLYATNLDVSSIGLKVLDEAVTMLVDVDTIITATYTGENANATTGQAEIVIAYIPDTDG